MLVGGLEHEFYFSIIYGIILPIDELICFKMGKTTNQDISVVDGGYKPSCYLGTTLITG